MAARKQATAKEAYATDKWAYLKRVQRTGSAAEDPEFSMVVATDFIASVATSADHTAPAYWVDSECCGRVDRAAAPTVDYGKGVKTPVRIVKLAPRVVIRRLGGKE
eukprot:COSAG02_NODE_9443_length_2214_cov_28.215603_2_plen_106_part_00